MHSGLFRAVKLCQFMGHVSPNEILFISFGKCYELTVTVFEFSTAVKVTHSHRLYIYVFLGLDLVWLFSNISVTCVIHYICFSFLHGPCRQERHVLWGSLASRERSRRGGKKRTKTFQR